MRPGEYIMIVNYVIIAALAVLVIGWIYLIKVLSNKLPGTTLSKEDLADTIGKAIDEAFKKYIPQPDAMASAIKDATVKAGEDIANKVQSSQKAMADTQKSLMDKWVDTEKKLAEVLKNTENAMSSSTAELSKTVSSLSGSVKDAMGDSVGNMQKVLSSNVQELSKVNSESTTAMKSALTEAFETTKAGLVEHADKLTQANQALVKQLEKIQELEKDIQKVLHIQEAVDGTLKTVTTTEEFRKTLETLQNHITQADKLIVEATRPRQIKLVENQG